MYIYIYIYIISYYTCNTICYTMILICITFHADAPVPGPGSWKLYLPRTAKTQSKGACG